MVWNYYLSYFLGGAFLVNAIPHFVSGSMGRPFQSPFARPRGPGVSSSTLNIVWGAINFVLAYLLILRVGDFDLRSSTDAATVGVGGLLMGLFLAWWFGRFNGGNTPHR